MKSGESTARGLFARRVSALTIRIRLLGSFEVEKGGAPLVLPARKSEALLAVLALRPGVAFGREQLIALFWPDVPEAQGRTSLRQALGHLRKGLGAEAVVNAADRIHLEPRLVWVDAAALDSVLRSPPLARETVPELWRGPLLCGFPAVEDPFADWLTAERQRIAERAGVGLEELVAALSAAGHTERAVGAASALLEREPLRESGHRALMRLHEARGDRAAALRQYERCRALMERAFGVAPSPETQRLRDDIAEAVAPRGEAPRTDDGEYRTSLAVLPFEYSEHAESKLLAEALTEDITTELSRFRQLGVVTRSTVISLTASAADREEVARTVGAGLLLSGSVRVLGERARVSAALSDARTRLQIWTERWDAGRDDLLDTVDRLTRNVVGALALRLDEARLGASRRRPRERLEVYECWLRGLECLRRGSPESDEEARGFFEQALALSPTFARAYSGISLSHFNDWSCQAWDRWDLRERLAFESAERAVELDDADHVTHVILGRIHVYRRNFEAGQRHLEHGLRLNSNDPDMLMHAALAYAQLGAAERACELAAAALQLNRKPPAWYHALAAFPLFLARRLDEAREYALRAPDALVDTPALLAATSFHLGDAAAARSYSLAFIEQIRSKITRGRPPSSLEPVQWLLHVNPLKRLDDQAYLLQGLAGAGLAAQE